MLHFVLLIYVASAHRQNRDELRNRWIDTETKQRQLVNELLKVAWHKWRAINNGYYHYQYQKTCDCEQCKMQAMNVYIEQNVPTHSEFAEGNEYALANFCENNATYNRHLTDSLTSIDGIFEMISLVLMDNRLRCNITKKLAFLYPLQSMERLCQ